MCGCMNYNFGEIRQFNIPYIYGKSGNAVSVITLSHSSSPCRSSARLPSPTMSAPTAATGTLNCTIIVMGNELAYQ